MAKKKQRRSFTNEFKAEAVRLCKVGDRSIGKVARDLDLTETALRAWVKQSEVDAATGRLRRSRLRNARNSAGFAARSSDCKCSATF